MTSSLWMDIGSTPRPSLQGRQITDLAIIGAGMTGLGLAWYAARKGLRCTVIERGAIGCGASGRNVGMAITGLGEHYARSIANFGRARAREIWEINRANHSLLRELMEEAGIACDYQRTGSLALGWDESECADLAASLRPLEEDGFPAVLLGEADLRREYGLSGCRQALFVPEDAQLHSLRLLHGLAAALDRYKVPIYENSPVLRLEADRPGEGFRLELPSGRLICRCVALATNAYTPQLLPDLDGWIEPVRGQCLAATAPEGFRFPAPAYTDRGHVYWRSYGDRMIFGGFDQLSSETERGYIDATTAVIQNALENFAKAVISGRWPVVSDHGAVVGGRLPAVNDQGAVVGGRLPAVNDQGAVVGGRLPVVSDQGAVVGERLPAVNDQGAVVGERLPVVNDQGAVVGERWPVVSDHGAVVGGRLPAVSGRKSVVSGHSLVSNNHSGLTTQDSGLLITHRWSGVMGYARDWFPIIGERPEGSGMYLAAGFTGHGFGYAFLAAKWLSELISGEKAAIPDFLSVRRVAGS